jgi:hypothetical protein
MAIVSGTNESYLPDLAPKLPKAGRTLPCSSALGIGQPASLTAKSKASSTFLVLIVPHGSLANDRGAI